MEIDPVPLKAGLENLKPDIRRLSDMKEVLYDQKWTKNAPDLELYYMYRGVKKEGELRYDITVIPAKTLGQEFTKTKGHEHLGAYQELYTVIEGQAIFLMQKTKEAIVEDVYIVKAEKGESIIIPLYYGHVTINPSIRDLRLSNWTSENSKSDYQLFERMRGACYYYTKDGWIKNKNYEIVPELRFEEPLKSVPENLDFLKG